MHDEETRTRVETTYRRQIRKLALKHVANVRKMYQDYEDAQVGSRFAPSHCIHGTYLWTSYDPICGACENGEGSFDYLRELRYAYDLAVSHYVELYRRTSVVVSLMADLTGTGFEHKNYEAVQSVKETLIDWSCELLDMAAQGRVWRARLY